MVLSLCTLLQVDLWDINKMQKVRTLTGHNKRVSAMSWNSHLLSTAGGDNAILNRDMRVPEDCIATLRGHRDQICGLKVLVTKPELNCLNAADCV